MSDEALADSESFDMEAAQEELSADLFKSEPEVTDEVVEEVIEEVVEEVIEEVEEPIEELRAAPKSWKKEMHEKWGSADPELQSYIELREQQMKEGIEVANGDTEFGRSLRDVMTPYGELLKAQGVDESTAIKYLMNAHSNLSNADEAGKIQLLNQMAESYGIKLDGTKVEPEMQGLQQRLNQIEQHLTKNQQASQQEDQNKAEKEVMAFASEHEFFDEVAGDIVPFINTGLTLEEAYEKALWANSVTRQKEIDRLDKEKVEKLAEEKHKKVEAAKKAKSANVKNQDTNKAPTGPTGKMYDDLDDLYTDIQNRS